jgi:hypothetical protein
VGFASFVAVGRGRVGLIARCLAIVRIAAQKFPRPAFPRQSSSVVVAGRIAPIRPRRSAVFITHERAPTVGSAARRAREGEFPRPPFCVSYAGNRPRLLSALSISPLVYKALEHSWERESCRSSVACLKHSTVVEKIAGGISVVQSYP